MDKPPLQIIGLLPPPRLLAAARVLAGISQRELAEAAGLTTASLARYETGASTMRTDSLGAIVDALRHFGVRFTGETHDVAYGLVFLKYGHVEKNGVQKRKARKTAE